MFSTPSIYVLNHENVDSVMRKPMQSSARKAFQERSINSKQNNDISKQTPLHKKAPLRDFQTPIKVSEPKECVPSWMMESLSAPKFESEEFIPPSKNDIKKMCQGYIEEESSPIQYDWAIDLASSLPKPETLVFNDFEEDYGHAGVWDEEEVIPERVQIDFHF